AAAELVRIVGLLDFAPESGFDAAFDRHVTPFAAGPGDAQSERVGVRGGRDGHAVGLADVDGDDGHLGFDDRLDGAHAHPHHTGAFGVGTDHESGNVDEVDNGQMEGAAQIDEADLLFCRSAVESARQMHGVTGDDPHGYSVDPGESGDDRLTPVRAHLEVRVAIRDRGEHLAHLVRTPAVLGDDPQHLVAGTVDRVGAVAPRWQLPHVLRQVGQHAADLGECVGFVAGEIVDCTGDSCVHLGATEFVL